MAILRVMRILLAAISLLMSVGCFGVLVLFLVVKVWPSYTDGGLTQVVRDVFWLGWVVMGLAFLFGMAFLLVGLSLLLERSDRSA